MFVTGRPAQGQDPIQQGRTVVIWISIDGVRPDYLDRSPTPFFDRMHAEGAFSAGLAPVFPSLTFPNHVSQATGRTVDGHGVPMNAFYDSRMRREFSFPGQPRLLQAEPIWTTAERQGRRTIVIDWVMSYGQYRGTAAAHHGDRYDGRLSDMERIQVVIDTWKSDSSDQPAQLLMGYMDHPDKIGHQFGPDAPEIAESMTWVDGKMQAFMDQALELFRERMNPEDTLYLLVTSDHGMSTIHHTVNPYELTGVSRQDADGKQAVLVTSGSVAHVFILDQGDADARQQRLQEVYETASQHDFADVYRREDLPARWGYAHPTRTGDIVLSLKPGYTFNRGTRGLTQPQSEVGGHLGMHGYDVADNPEMNGILLVWRYPEPLGGIDLGPTHALQLHATIARLLDIQPARGAYAEPVLW
jgi:predicted AlkP superfamily pyrophosphatase or phosphodiesterase